MTNKKDKSIIAPEVDLSLLGKKPVKIVLAMACQDIIRAKTANAIGCAIIGDPTIADFLMMQSCDIVSSRTWLVQQAIEKGATHICFIDSDVLFPFDTIRKLLAHNKDIVACDYNKREFPLKSVVTQLQESEKSETELYRAAVAGAGMLLINLKVFTEGKLANPWFNFGRDKFGRHILGEDAWFCNTARDAGYELWIDPTIKVYHLGEFGY